MQNRFKIPMYICMQNQRELSYIKNHVKTHLLIEEMEINIQYTTTSIVALSSEILNETRTGIYIIEVGDIEAREENIIREIREKHPGGVILLILQDIVARNKIFGSYLSVMGYFLKEDMQKLLHEIKRGVTKVWEVLLSNSNPWNGIFCIKSHCKIYALQVEEIYYVEALKNQHKVIFHMKDVQIKSAVTLQHLKERFNRNNFFICHKSMIVNMNHVRLFDKKERLIHMYDNSKVECSVRNIKKLEEIMVARNGT